MDKVKKWFSCLLFISFCSLLSLSISVPASAYTSQTLRGVAVGLLDASKTEKQRKGFSGDPARAYLNENNAYTSVYARLYFSAFNPYNKDFSLSFIISSDRSLYNDFSPSFNVVDAYNLNVTVTPVSELTVSSSPNLAQYYFVNVTGTCSQYYWGNSTDHIDVVLGQSSLGWNIYQPSLVIAQDVNTDEQVQFKENVTQYLQDIIDKLDGLDVDALIDAQEETTDAVNNPEYIQQEKEDLQDAKDDAQGSATDSQGDVDNSTSSLLAVLTNFLGVLTSVTPSNCYLDGSLFPHINLGQLNLCENSPPPAITALGSLLLIAFVIPLVYNTIKMIINLFSEFQR